MSWVLLIGAAWLSLAVLVAVLIGRSIHVADVREAIAMQARTQGAPALQSAAVSIPGARHRDRHAPARRAAGRAPATRSA